jgi:hypothetical protein
LERDKLAVEDVMTLRDHFHPPLKNRPAFSSLHAMWSSQIVSRMNLQLLSDDYVCQSELKLGPTIEVDVAALETGTADRQAAVDDSPGNEGGLAVAVDRRTFSATAPKLSADISVFDPDAFEIRIFHDIGEWKLVAAIELVSEANKDRPDTRRALATKVAGYIQKGVSAVVVDVVTNRSANFHAEISEVMRWPDELSWESDTELSAVAYRTLRKGNQVRLDVWPHSVSVGEDLPTLPLWLASDLCVPLELEMTYSEACRSLKIRSV